MNGVTKVVLVDGSVSVLPNLGGEYKMKPESWLYFMLPRKKCRSAR